MNKIFRIVFNRATGRWVVASEMARGRKKAACVSTAASAFLMLGVSAPAWALNPDGTAPLIVNDMAFGTTDSGQCQVIAGDGSTAFSTVACSNGMSSGYNNVNQTNSVVVAQNSLSVGGYQFINGKDASGNALTIGAAGAAIKLNNGRITGLASGTAASDAVNMLQARAIAGAFGGGATLDGSGNMVAPSYALTQANAINGTSAAATNVGAAFQSVDNALGNLTTRVTNNSRYFQAGGANDGSDDASALGAGIAIGAGAHTEYGDSPYNPTPYQNAIAIGTHATALGGGGAIALGDSARVTYTNIAIGAGADASTSRQSIAIGLNSKVPGWDSVSLGYQANASADNAVALGANSVADRVNTVSVGKVGGERQVVNVAKGTSPTDAVNVSQLQGITTALGGAAAVSADGTIKAPSYALPRTIAINGSGAAAGDVGTALGMIDTALDKVNTTANKGFNLSADAGATSQNIAPGATAKFAAGTNATVSRSGDTITYGVVANPTFAGMVTANGGLTVGAGKTVDMGGNKVTNVAAGLVASDSKEAVNGGQLYATNQAVTQNASDIATIDGRVATAEGNITTLQGNVTDLDGRVSANEGDISTLNTNVTQIDGRVTTAEGNITRLDQRVTTNEGDISTLNTNVSNLDGRVTNVEGSVTTITNQLNSGTVGLVQQSAAGANLTVGKDTDGAAVDFAGTAGGRKLLNVEDGTVAADSKDAVNGSQLSVTNDRVTTAEGNITTLQGDVMNLDSRVTTNEGDITNLDQRVTKNEGDISTINSNVSDLDGRVTNVEGSVSDLTTQINNGSVGLVQYDDASGVVTVAAGNAGATVDFRNSMGASRRLKGVAAGAQDEDAVNVSQLKTVVDSLGGGASIDPTTGAVTAPTYVVNNIDGTTSTSTTVGGAVSFLNTNVTNLSTNVTNLATQINSGAVGLVQQSAAGANLMVGKDTDGAAVDFAGTAGARKLVNVADGAVAAGSKDAVNGGQLYGVSQSVANAMGGNATVNADGTISAPTYSLTNADGTKTEVHNVGDAVTNIDNRVYQNTAAIANNTTQIDNLNTQISKGEVGLVKQDATTRAITVAQDSDGASVSLAGTAGDRTLTGVAAAKADNDAVNLGQLKSAGVIGPDGESKSVVAYDDADKTSMTMGGEGATTAVAIHNVADGVADHDAVNVTQLNQRINQTKVEVLSQANAYTDQRINDVWGGMDKIADELGRQDERISRMGAMSSAMMTMSSSLAGMRTENRVATGVGYSGGQPALAVGYQRSFVDGKAALTVGGSFTDQDKSVGIGAGFGW